MSDFVEIRVARTFPADLASAYAWLTDIQDDDVRRTSAVLASRRVRERSKTRIVYEGRTRILGREIFAVTEVDLAPPDRWQARVVEGPRMGSHTSYVLSRAAGGTRLDVTYRFTFVDPRRTRLLRLLKPLVRRALVRMWAGFEADMRRELAAAAVA